MKATETNLLSFLKGPKQFLIPIYQRRYSWTLSQCQQLWSDVIKAGTNDAVRGHFIGSVVYVERGLYQISAVPQLLVIDGQQRLTTLTLLLDAYGDALRKRGEDGEREQRRLYNYYLLNNDEEGELRYKLLLTQSDKPTLIRLLDDKPLPAEPSQRLMENHRYFLDQINSTEDLEVIFRGIQKLLIVDISLNREYDNPQLIFESLNSTGLELSQADLIRNYVLMGLEHQDQNTLYTEYWFPMEELFQSAPSSDSFDRFMRDYLTFRTGSIPNVREVYAEFKDYVQSETSGSITEIVRDLFELAQLYGRIALGKETDPHLGEVFADLQQLRVDVAYPFILEAYLDYQEQLITAGEFQEVVRTVETFVFRRSVCGVSTNALNNIFARLGSEIDKNRYLESLAAALLVKDSYRRFPDDEEFRRELIAKDIYHFRSLKYLLRKLENTGSKERVQVDNCTIEHILPQNENLSETWQQDLGESWKEIQIRYLHTLGNLTLTGYNPELSDRSFLEKRDMEGGFAKSPLRLNQHIGRLERWTELEIQERAEQLANRALEVWPRPLVDDALLNEYASRQKRKRLRSEDSGTEGTLQNSIVRSTQLEYWTALATRLREKGNNLKHRPVEARYFLTFLLGDRGAYIDAFFNVRDGRFGVLVQARQDFYAYLRRQREVLEENLGFPLDWIHKPEQNRSTLMVLWDDIDLTQREQWEELLSWQIEKLEKIVPQIANQLAAFESSQDSELNEKETAPW